MFINNALALPQTSPASFLIEDSGFQGDNSCIYMNNQAMKKLSFSNGDIISLINPKIRKQTLGILCQDFCDGSPIKIRLNHIFRKNLAVQVDDLVQLSLFKQIVELNKLVVKKIGGTASSATSENHQKISLIEYFQNYYRPVCRDDIFQIKNNLGIMQFMITHTEPSINGLVTPQTLIAIDWQIYQL